MQYLGSVSKRIEEYAVQYCELYADCYNQIEEISKLSVQSVLSKGLAGIIKGTGQAIAKIPVISNGSVYEVLIATGSKLGDANLRKIDKAMERFIGSAANCTMPFVENIKAVSRIYNEPMEIMFDNR